MVNCVKNSMPLRWLNGEVSSIEREETSQVLLIEINEMTVKVPYQYIIYIINVFQEYILEKIMVFVVICIVRLVIFPYDNCTLQLIADAQRISVSDTTGCTKSGINPVQLFLLTERNYVTHI